jgi:hypothetical protein
LIKKSGGTIYPKVAPPVVPKVGKKGEEDSESEEEKNK